MSIGDPKNNPCPTGCPRREVGCHNVKTCERWAKHVERKRAQYRATLERGKDVRMSREMRRDIEKG